MINVPQIPKPQDPKFFDKVIVQLQDILKNKLTWLDYSFGQAQKCVHTFEKREHFYPGVHIKNGEYINVFPNEKYGNFSFFVLDEPQIAKDYKKFTVNDIRSQYAIVFWFNLDRIFEGSEDRDLEAVKAQIFKILTRETFLSFGKVTVNRIYTQAESIYKGFTHREIESQFLKQPFAGLRFEGTMEFTEDC